MLMLHQHITRATIALFLIALCLSGVVSYFAIQSNNLSFYQHQLQSHINVLKSELPNIKDVEAFAKRFKEATDIRLTLMNEKGIVIADSDHESETMSNHAHREEVMRSEKMAYGHAIRESETTGSNYLYVAHRFELEGQRYVLRLAANIDTIMHEFYPFWIKITLIFSVALLLGLYGTYVFSQKIRQEIDKITANLQQISDKEYHITLSSHFSLEFFEIANYLKRMAAKLEKRAKQKRKYTAKIKLISQQRSDVISAISHEFKNPIASITGYAQTLMDDPNANPQIRERFLGKIIQNGQKISSMIDRLTLTTKFENGDFTAQLTTFDVVKVTNDLVQSFRERNSSRTLVCELPEHYSVTADRTMMEIVISNLIENALKYSEEAITITLEEGALHVKDSGVGIKEDEIEKITKKFYRSNTHSWDNSMGLGLALVSYILKLHHTQLDVQSTLGIGSDFSFKLPTNNGVLS